MDLQAATDDQLREEMRRRVGFDPTALWLANMNELALELKTRGQAFVSGIYVVDEETMASKEAGKIGVLHDGDPILCCRLACRVFHDTGYDLVHDRLISMTMLKDIVNEELGDMFEFEDPGAEDDEDPDDE